jgi:fatty acid desaturase
MRDGSIIRDATQRLGAVAGGLRRWEWPTLALALAVYGGWGALTWTFPSLPLWLSLPAGAWLLAWHNSLQHETIHNHPTPVGWINRAIGWLPLGLWLPYDAYRESHLRHHLTDSLTHPVDDPESFYWTPEQWSRLPPLLRLVLNANATLAGRLLLGPALMAGRYWLGEARRMRRGDWRDAKTHALHALGVTAVLLWIAAAGGMPLWLYLVGIVYPANSLNLLRSYAEHLQSPGASGRTAIVRAGPLLSLLFLRNNLHALHHARPALPWYRLRLDSSAWDVTDLYFDGYGELARRFMIRPIASPIYSGAPAAPV